MITALVIQLIMAASPAPAPAQQANFTGHYQRWLIADAQGYIFDIQAASVKNGALLGVWSYWGGPNQQWQLRPGRDGSYSIVNGNGKLVTVENNSRSIGGVVNQWDDADQVNQHYRIEPVADQRYNIININSNLCLTVEGGGGAGALVVQGVCNNAASVWQFYAIDDNGAIVAPNG